MQKGLSNALRTMHGMRRNQLLELNGRPDDLPVMRLRNAAARRQSDVSVVPWRISANDAAGPYSGMYLSAGKRGHMPWNITPAQKPLQRGSVGSVTMRHRRAHSYNLA